MKDLSEINGKRFSYRDVMEPDEDYLTLNAELNRLIQEGRIRPVQKSGTVSFFPYFAKEYFINPLQKRVNPDRKELHQLAPVLLEYYSSHIDHYAEDQNWLLPLSEWLKSPEGKQECSLKERSYEIYRNEKTLEGSEVRRILSRCGITVNQLCCYRTFEPFFCEKISDTGAALVLENKDPWYSIIRALRKQKTSLFLNEKIMYVIYGEGRKVDSEAVNSRLQDFLSGLNPNPRKVLYCGDIDRAGAAIFEKCRMVNQEIAVLPFVKLYNAMIEKAPEKAEDNEPTEDRKTGNRHEAFSLLLSNPQYVQTVLNRNLRIPQEVLSLQDYLRMCGADYE